MALPVSACTPVDNPVRAIACNGPLILACWGSEGDYHRFDGLTLRELFQGGSHRCVVLHSDTDGQTVGPDEDALPVQDLPNVGINHASDGIVSINGNGFEDFLGHYTPCALYISNTTQFGLPSPCNSANSPAGLTAGGTSLEGV